MSNTVIKTTGAPAPIGPYNQAILCGNLLFISGQIALDPKTNTLDNEDIRIETNRVMHNLAAILSESGMGFEHVMKTTIFLTDMALFTDVNEVYAGFFTGVYPARETVAVKGLPKNVNVEISMIASR